MLNVICRIAQIGDAENRRADDIPIMDKSAILCFIGVALGAKTDHGGIFLVRHNTHNAVRGHGVFVQHKRDGLPLLNGVRVYLFYIDQRACVIRRLHGTGQHGEHLQSGNSCAHQQKRQNHHQRNQNAADHIPYFFERFAHIASFLLFNTSARSDIIRIMSCALR